MINRISKILILKRTEMKEFKIFQRLELIKEFKLINFVYTK